MRYNNCDCKCLPCETGPGDTCYTDDLDIRRNYADGIFLAGEEDGVFKVVIRRMLTDRGSISIPPVDFAYFTICIPMSGDIGSYHFTSNESPTDCYAYIKKQSCSDSFGSSGTQYYFWIGTVAGMTEIPTSSVDKANYLHIHTVVTTPIYYIMRLIELLEEPMPRWRNWVIPPLINQNIPYVFWASPKTYEINLEFGDGGFIGGWCHYSGGGTKFTTANRPYSHYDGIYLLDAGTGVTSPINTGRYFGAGASYGETEVVGQYAICQVFPHFFQMYDMSLSFAISGIGTFWDISFFCEMYDGFSSSFARFNKPFSLDEIGSQPFTCVDNRILTGEYGEYEKTTSNEFNTLECPRPVVDQPRCGRWAILDPIEVTLTCTVSEWRLKYGCYTA